jgi:hypothetical protein
MKKTNTSLNEADLVERYIFNVFIPKLMKQFSRATSDVSGDLLWLTGGKLKSGQSFTTFFATPSLEERKVFIQFESPRDGIVDVVSYNWSLDEWSMDVDTDIHTYIQKLQETLNKLTVKPVKLK